MTSVISEEFGLSPDDAGHQDYEKCISILQLRRYRDVKDAIESADKDNPPSPEVTRSPEARTWSQVMRVKQQAERR